MFPLQQPLVHDVESHTQPVPLHRCPAAHAVHAPPPIPHADTLWPLEQVVALLQQPLEHEVGVHTH